MDVGLECMLKNTYWHSRVLMASSPGLLSRFPYTNAAIQLTFILELGKKKAC